MSKSQAALNLLFTVPLASKRTEKQIFDSVNNFFFRCFHSSPCTYFNFFWYVWPSSKFLTKLLL